MARLYCVAGLILFIKVELSLDENQVPNKTELVGY